MPGPYRLLSIRRAQLVQAISFLHDNIRRFDRIASPADLLSQVSGGASFDKPDQARQAEALEVIILDDAGARRPAHRIMALRVGKRSNQRLGPGIRIEEIDQPPVCAIGNDLLDRPGTRGDDTGPHRHGFEHGP